MQLSGDEQFKIGDQSIGLTMLDFWRFKYSNIFNLQEVIAEFLVAKALGRDVSDNDEYWTLFDIKYRGKRVEVKETSYYHPWNEGKTVSKQRVFGIEKANSIYENESTYNKYERQCDVYVFCLNNGETQGESNPLNLNNWEFYVVPTKFINEHCGDNKKISLGRIRNLGFQAKRYDEIKDAVDAIINQFNESV